MKLSNHRKIPLCAKLTVLISIIILINGCMSMGMKIRKNTKGHHMMTGFTEEAPQVNTDQVLDQMIIDAVSELSSEDLNIVTVAVWRIKSRTTDLNVEMIRRKLITHLVNLDRFKVLSRERLEEVLEEQGLSLSGAIEKESTVEIGTLIGVEGFIDSYVSNEDNRLVLNLSLVETKSGLIVWAKTIEGDVYGK